jgi:ligand-binding sensor domain-containing protein
MFFGLSYITMTRLKIFILLWFSLYSLYGRAQNKMFDQVETFTHLSEKDGLQNKYIFCMMKDSRGILWAGTQGGLNRFDGSHFYSFKKNRAANTLPDNSVNSICEDKSGNIWGGTNNGIFKYSPDKNIFTNYYPTTDDTYKIVSNILCDAKGDIYAATTLTTLKFNFSKNNFELVDKLTHTKDSANLYVLSKNRMVKDEENNCLWFATAAGLLCYDLNKHILISSKNSNNNPLFESRNTSTVYKSPSGNFWFFDNSNKDVVLFDPTTKKMLKKISVKAVDADAKVSTIVEDKDKRLWVSSWTHTIMIIDVANENKISIIKSKEGNANTIAADFFWAGLEDQNGTIWLATLNGISIYNPGKYLYKPMRLPDKIPVLQTSSIYAADEDPNDKSWWILTNTRILIHYIPENGSYELFYLDKAKKNKKNLVPQNVYRFRFLEKNLVIPSSSGVWQIKNGSKTMEPFDILPKEYADFTISNFIKANEILYCTDGSRLLEYNMQTKTGRWISHTAAQNTIAQEIIVNDLLWKPGHKLFWTLESNYLASFGSNSETKLIKIIKNDTLEAGGYFHTADMDNAGNVWLANKGVGLYRYNPGSGDLKYWTVFDGLMDNHLHSVKADDKGNIWMLYFNKGGVFNPAENSFTNFTIPYAENKHNYFNTLLKKSDGTMMGNVNNDLYVFNATNLTNKPMAMMPQLSNISVSGTDYFLDNINELKLEPNQNSIRFKYGLLVDPSLFPYEFKYILEGSDTKWVNASASNEANYNNLPPGKYTFRLIAKGKNNSWQSNERVITINIRTPFYKSNWFYALIALLIASIIYALYKYRLLQQKKYYILESKSQLLEKEKTMVMYESLKQQLNPHFLFNSLTSLSGLIETNQQVAGNFLEQMSGIYRYILKNGDTETVTIKDEISFVKLYISLQQTRFKKGLQINIDVPDDYLHYKIAPVTLQNLIENAIKHNIIDVDLPLVIDIFIEHDYIVIKNNLQKKNMVETSNKKGLAQFETLYKYLIDKPILIEETTQYFIIKIPLI